MKIIDERGRLFGKINVIDFLIVLFLFCLMPMFYFGYKILTKKPEVVKERFIEIERNCQLVEVKPEILALISVGDKELDWDGEIIGEIISLGESEPYEYEFDIGEGEKIVEEATDLRQLKAKLKLKAEVEQDKLYYKDKMIKIGSPLEFKTIKYSITAFPFIKEAEIVEERTIDIYVILKDLKEDIIKKISIGDKEVDESGRTIAEILNLGKIENSSFEFNLEGGNFVVGRDSDKKQIFVKMRLECQVKDGDRLYFKGEKIKYNTPIEFKTDKYKAIALVTRAFEITSPIKEKWLSLEVKFSGVLPEISKVIQKGDIEKDPFGKPIASIRSIISNKSSQVLTPRDNKFISLKHPFQRDILVSLHVLCVEKEGLYYFKNYPVKMGNNIVFISDLYSISGTIVGIEMK